MDSFVNNCVLCLSHNNNVKNVLSEDDDNIIIEEKLKFVLPDDNITSYYHKIVNHKPLSPKLICTNCLHELNSVYKFKQKCLKNFKFLSEYIDQGPSLLKQELLKPPKNAVEAVVVKIEQPEIVEASNDLVIKIESHEIHEQKFENDLEEIVVKGEPTEEFHNEIDIKEDPLLVESFEPDIIYNGTTTYKSEDPTRPYKCPICHKSFKTGKYLSTHKLIHSGEKPFTCDVCQKKFRNRYHLISHKFVHTGGEKPFKCQLCDMGFLSQSHLTVHERVHTGVKPFVCDVCGKAFSQRNILKTHLRTHSGVKPYECDVCEKAFAHKKTLRAHKRTHVVYKGFEGGMCP